jgi:HAD superfamily hydrolase (TIGR01509 family)
MPRTLNTFIFDCDGVITDSMPYHYRAWKKVFADFGLNVSKFQIYEREGQKGIESIRELCALQGVPFIPKEARRLLQKKEKYFKRHSRTKYIPGARSFIKYLDRKGCALALVTGTSRQEIRKVLPPDLFDCFTVTVCGCDVKKGKPHPEPYLKALRELKIHRNEALVIENAPFGIRSAKRAGLHCLALETSLPARYLKEADFIFPDYRSLRDHIEGCYAQ